MNLSVCGNAQISDRIVIRKDPKIYNLFYKTYNFGTFALVNFSDMCRFDSFLCRIRTMG